MLVEEKPFGRPTVYTPQLALDICDRIAHGESLRKICNDDAMPCRKTVHLWLVDEAHADFLHQYTVACNIRSDEIFDEIVDIADDGINDYSVRASKDGGMYTVADTEHIQRSKLRVETRKWYLSKMVPKKYGEKLDITTGGESLKPEPPVQGLIDKAIGSFLGAPTTHGTQRNPSQP